MSLPYNSITVLAPVQTEQMDVLQFWNTMRHFSVFLRLGKWSQPDIFLTPGKKLKSGGDEERPFGFEQMKRSYILMLTG